MKRIFKVVYTKNGDDGAAYTEMHTACIEDVQCAMNAIMIAFNHRHPKDDRIESIWEVNKAYVCEQLREIANEGRVVTSDQADALDLAILMLMRKDDK